MKWSGPMVLASRSPRRKQLLEEAGFDVIVQPPEIDDGRLRRGKVAPPLWVTALAYWKARWVADRLRGIESRSAVWWNDQDLPRTDGCVLGADTVCVVGDTILGQPRDAQDAKRMLLLMNDVQHLTLTGVCVLPLDGPVRARWMLCDCSRVRMGAIGASRIDEYIASEEWRGKAGAYNLSERIAAGWPIECADDPSTVMGLPMRKLNPFLNSRGRGS